jgi:hypothetical protein
MGGDSWTAHIRVRHMESAARELFRSESHIPSRGVWLFAPLHTETEVGS